MRVSSNVVHALFGGLRSGACGRKIWEGQVREGVCQVEVRSGPGQSWARASVAARNALGRPQGPRGQWGVMGNVSHAKPEAAYGV
eukprot:3459306-Lingulodinium_polyedra.AAC.1